MPLFVGDVMNSLNSADFSDMEIENALIEFRNSKFKKCGLDDEYPNLLLREDVLNILDKFCTVIYYPIHDKNNGFHINDIPIMNARENIVFINTAQTIEKQVFTAAHELGHIWKVDEYLIDKMGLTDSREDRENIINRFAAILLMPEDIFRLHYNIEQEKYKDKGITIIDLLKIIVSLMNSFFAPRKAVIYRMKELGLIYSSTADILLGKNVINEEQINRVVDKLLQDYGLNQFLNASNRKWINGISDLLDSAEETRAVPDALIKKMRRDFSLEKKSIPIPEQMDKVIETP